MQIPNTIHQVTSNKQKHKKMPVTTRKQSKEQKEQKEQQFQKGQNQNQVKKNHANIDFENASKEWRKNKIKHENGYFTYVGNHE